MTQIEPLEILSLYADKDEKFLRELLKSLKSSLAYLENKGLVSFWDKSKIVPGADTVRIFDNHLQSARVVLLLISADFIASDLAFSEKMLELLKRKRAGKTHVIPILYRLTFWNNTPFGELEPLPPNNKFVSSWPDKDEALFSIAEGVGQVVHNLLGLSQSGLTGTGSVSATPAETPIDEEDKSMPYQPFTHGYALFVGVGNDLPVTVDDATALHKLFTDPARAGYPAGQAALLTSTDAKREYILDALDRLIGQVKNDPEATAIVYFSGHGIKISRSEQEFEYFLIPYGYDRERLNATAISSLEFTEKLRQIKARKLVVLLDCCHAGGIPAFKAPGIRVEKSAMYPDMLSLQEGRGRVIIASSNEDQSSLTGHPYSIFTTCLLDALGGKASGEKDGMARILDISRYLLDQVPLRSEQQQYPVISNIQNLDENFPICFYAGGTKGVPGAAPSQSNSTKLTTARIESLKRRQKQLQDRHNRLSEQIEELEPAIDREVNILVRRQYKHDLEQAQANLKQVETELDEVERQFQ
ncbi:MAG TPA: caspase family protein [Ktedonobacteraceae bacterium]